VSGGAAINYTFTYYGDTLDIGPATLTVTAHSYTRMYGELNPTFSYDITGWKNDEDIDVLTGEPYTSCSATQYSDVVLGGYTIQVLGGTARYNNYSFNYISGTLTITKATPSILWSDPADIFTSEPLSSLQLNAEINPPGVLGIFSYNPHEGTYLIEGSHRALNTTFYSSDDNWTNASATVYINVIAEIVYTLSVDNTSIYYELNGDACVGYTYMVNVTASSNNSWYCETPNPEFVHFIPVSPSGTGDGSFQVYLSSSVSQRFSYVDIMSYASDVTIDIAQTDNCPT